MKMTNKKIAVQISYEADKKLYGLHIGGAILEMNKPITGAYLVEAWPLVDGETLESGAIHSFCYELTAGEAYRTARRYLLNN